MQTHALMYVSVWIVEGPRPACARPPLCLGPGCSWPALCVGPARGLLHHLAPRRTSSTFVSVSMSFYVYIYIYVYHVYVHIHMYTYLFEYAYTYTYTKTYIYGVCTYLCGAISNNCDLGLLRAETELRFRVEGCGSANQVALDTQTLQLKIGCKAGSGIWAGVRGLPAAGSGFTDLVMDSGNSTCGIVLHGLWLRVRPEAAGYQGFAARSRKQALALDRRWRRYLPLSFRVVCVGRAEECCAHIGLFSKLS